ncbi:hypothetical protein L211DRAFT_641494 [Terfezia boudieri ATCC MYA-4762]|uniref:Uncharacterized protein n=1 Tax=Terfezia boudieri ATCC MYA-4762 TaxID=1051890 RepID=A0A3N4L8P5_9PEZI|nr:hypothetical protein L211DRAFT_641494 [Terfezia boudieri ATCC MYA-4762]
MKPTRRFSSPTPLLRPVPTTRISVSRAASSKLDLRTCICGRTPFFHCTAASPRRVRLGSVYASVYCGGLGVAVPDKPKDGFGDVVIGNEGGGAPHLEDRGARGEGEAGERCPGPAEYEGADACAEGFKLSEMEVIFKLKDNQLYFRLCLIERKKIPKYIH